MRVTIELYLDTPDGREWITPTALTAIARADGAGATVEDFGSLLDGSHVKETGVYYADTGEGGGSYSENTWYEVVASWTYAGEARSAYRRFYYQSAGATTTALDPPTLTKVVNDGDGDGITLTVAAASGQSTDRIRAIVGAQGVAPADRGGRIGDGDINVTGLTNLTAYDVTVIHEWASDANVKSISSRRLGIVCHDGTRLADAIGAGIIAALRADSNLAAYCGDGNWAKTDARKHVFDGIEDGWVGGRAPGRAPFIEVEWDGGNWPERRSGTHQGYIAELPFRIRCTCSPRHNVDAFVQDVRRGLQTDGNRYLGDSAHVVALTMTVAQGEESFLMQRRLLSGTVRIVATPGVNG